MTKSFYDHLGQLRVRCNECKFGANGNNACAAGSSASTSRPGCCSTGELLDSLPKPRHEWEKAKKENA